MGGAELIGREEQEAVSEVIGRGVLFRYGFNEKRKNIFKVLEFESQFSKYMGCSYALAVSSGSAAVRVAVAALGIKRGDEVITQSFGARHGPGHRQRPVQRGGTGHPD